MIIHQTRTVVCGLCMSMLFLMISYGQEQKTNPMSRTASETSQPDNQKMTLDVKDTDISDVIRMISKGYGLNVILDRDITGKVTLHLSDAPILEGLKTLAASNGWELVKDGSVFRIRKPIQEQKSSIYYVQDRLTVDVQNMDVTEFIKEMSSKAAISIVPDSKINGKVTGKLFQVPLDDGLSALLQGNGFKVTKIKNIYRVSAIEGSQGGPTGGFSPPRPRTSGGGSLNVECVKGKLSVDVTDANLDEVINAIAVQSESQIIIYGKLGGETVNAKLNRVPLTEGLALLLGGTRYTFVQKDSIILIGDRNTATPAGQTLSKSELIHLRHIKADIVPSILPKDIPVNNIKIIKEQNALLISGTSEDIVSAIEFLHTIDIPTPQVVIDVLVVEYTRNQDYNFGLTAKGNIPDPKNAGNNEISFPYLSINRVGQRVNEIFSSLGFTNSIINEIPPDFFISLRLLEQDQKAKVLAHPSITVLNGNKAKIDIGQTQYFKIIGGTATEPTRDFKPISFGISLNITPWISKSGQITAEISPEISNSIGINEDGYPDVSKRSITTTVRIDDGKTLILGGLLKSDERKTHQKVPFLGDIPILGYLFKTTIKSLQQTNLVIYITPHIVDQTGYVDLSQEIRKFDENERKSVFRTDIPDSRKSNDTPSSAPDSHAVKKIEQKPDTTNKSIQPQSNNRSDIPNNTHDSVDDTKPLQLSPHATGVPQQGVTQQHNTTGSKEQSIPLKKTTPVLPIQHPQQNQNQNSSDGTDDDEESFDQGIMELNQGTIEEGDGFDDEDEN